MLERTKAATDVNLSLAVRRVNDELAIRKSEIIKAGPDSVHFAPAGPPRFLVSRRPGPKR